jgi:uncharacterized protein involved in propanediol utilization
MRPGVGACPAHHGEVLQGAFEGSRGRQVRALVTLPGGASGSTASFVPGPGGLTAGPGTGPKAREAARRTLEYLGVGRRGGSLIVRCATPVGWGMGSSTSDVVASIRAVADACDVELAPEIVARLAVEAEAASDPVMFGGRAVLFEHRAGRVVEDLGGGLPELEVVGFRCGPAGRVETLELPEPRYGRRELEEFARLRETLRRAVRERCARLVGEVASASARINQEYLPKTGFRELVGVSRRTGAVGINVAHSGSVAGLLFDPADPAVGRRVREARRALASLGLESWRFRPACYDLPGPEASERCWR